MKTAKLIYVGRRMWGESLSFVFLDGKKERGWQSVGWVQIGHIYEGERSGKNVKISKHPKELGEVKADDPRLEEWDRQDKIAEALVRRRKASNKAKRQLKLVTDDLPWQLRKAIKGMSFFEMSDFISGLVDYIHQTEKEKSK